MTDSALTYITIFLTSILGLFLAFVSFSFARLIQKYHKIKEEKENLEKNFEAEADKIVKQARDKAQKIINEAIIVSQDTKKEITSALQNASQDQINDFKNLQDDIKNQILTIFKTTTGQFEAVAKSEIENFQSNLQGQITSTQGFLQKTIEEALAGIQSEIDEYKEKSLKEAENSIIEIIKLATKNFLGEVISPDDHEKLVMSSLEEAKKENLFGILPKGQESSDEVKQEKK